MRFAHRPALAFAICALAAATACSRGPISGSKPDGGGAAGTTGGAGTMGPAGAAGSSPAAGTTGAAGSNAAAGASGAAGAPGHCTPGETVCTGPSQASLCKANGVPSPDFRFCSYGCAQNFCRECPPGDSMCNTATTVQKCPANGSRWNPPEVCDNGCENGACAPPCKPGVGECLHNDADVRICGGDGIWGVAVNCKLGCSNGACRVCEPFTTMCLTSKSSRQCKDDGTWGTAVTCATSCANGICTDCQPDTGMCVDDKNIRSCNNNGTWEPPVPCEGGICSGDGCRECKPGTTRCLEGDVMQTCNSDGSFSDDIACPNTCKTDKCASNPGKVFVTSTTYKAGDLGGLTGADAKCQARAMTAGLTGTFRAWLSDATGQPATRFAKERGPYLLVTGSVVANNWTALASGTLRHAINITELGTPPSPATIPGCSTPLVWTNTTNDGYVGDPAFSCSNWTASSGFSAWFGTTSSQTAWTNANCPDVVGTSVATGCGALAPIYCVEQ